MSIFAIRLPEVIGLTILHSLWQITLVWIVLVVVLRLWPKASSAVRYTLAISTLMLAVLITAATAVNEWQSHAGGEEITTLYNGTSQRMHAVYTTVKQTDLSRIADALHASVPILAWLWCTGLVVMGVRFAGSFYYLRRLRAQKNIAAIAPAWEQDLKRLSTALGLRRNVAIAISARISSPLTLGSIFPIILVPAGLLAGMSTAQIEAILVHELYHIKRRDYIVNICQALVEVLLFYHPAIWHINSIIREERENCCDDQTVAFCGDAITYARALTQIQEIKTLAKPTLAMSATGPDGGNFSNRIKRLFHIYPNPAQDRSKGIIAIGFLVVYLGIVLASANVSTAEPVEPEHKLVKKSLDDYNAFSEAYSDSITADTHSYVPDEEDITPQPVAVKKIRSVDIQRADTAVSEQSLDKCLEKVRLLLKMVSIYRPAGERFKYTEFSAADSLKIAGSVDYAAKVSRQPQFYEAVNLLRITNLDLVDTASSIPTIDMVLEKIHRSPVDSVSIYSRQQAIDDYSDDEKDAAKGKALKRGTFPEEFTNGVAVQVFPNSANGLLNISFTPTRHHSRVKMVLVDSDGKVVKEITDSTYDNIPAALQVDVSGYQKGIYILQINIAGAKSLQRVVVE